MKSPKPLGLFLCGNFVYHKAGYIIPCSSFSFKLTNDKTITRTYKNDSEDDSKDVIYNLICKTCNNFYLGQTQVFRPRTGKHKSDVKNLYNSTCRICSEHLIFKYSYCIMKQIQRLEDIKKNDTFSDGNLL